MIRQGNSVRQRIYNIVLDDLTNKLMADGYKVLMSQAYPEEGEPKYIIWVNPETHHALRFFWDIQADSFDMQNGHYTDKMEYKDMRWASIRHYNCNNAEIDESKIPEMIAPFLHVRTTGNRTAKTNENPMQQLEGNILPAIKDVFENKNYFKYIWIGLGVIIFLLSKCNE